MNEDKMKLSEYLLVLRSARGVGQQELAEVLGVGKSAYCNYERGKRVPDLGGLKKLAEYYNVPLNSFYRLPFETEVFYSEGILDDLDNATAAFEKAKLDNAHKDIYRADLKAALKRVTDERDEALIFPEINLQYYEDGTETRRVRLDMRGEVLINRALKLLLDLNEKPPY